MNTIKVAPNEVRAGDVLVAWRMPEDATIRHMAGCYARDWACDYAARVVDASTVGVVDGRRTVTRARMVDGREIGLPAAAHVWVRR